MSTFAGSVVSVSAAGWAAPRSRLAIVAILAGLYLAFGHISFLPLVQNVLVTPAVFYPEGIALAFALHFGAWTWPGIFLGQLALALTCGLPWLPALGISASNSAQACLAVWLFRRLGLDPRLERARDLAGLLLLIIFVLQPFGATCAHLSLWLGGVITTPLELVLSWRNWWMGCAIAQMLVTPLLLSLFAGQRTRSEVVGDVLIGLAVVTPAMVAVEYLWSWTAMSSVVVLLAPVFIWLAAARGLVALCVGSLYVAAVALFATGRGWGPFAVGAAASILDLNIYLASMTIGKQFIAVFLRQLARQREIEDRLRAEEELLRREAAAREQALEAAHRGDLEAKLKTSLAAAAVAHEIAQPLSTILLQSKLALHETGDAPAALAVVAAQAKQVVGTIDKMKALLRNVQTAHRPVDLDQVVRSALLYNADLLERHDVAVRVRRMGGSFVIDGDDAQLLLALNNILRNAVEAIAGAAPERREIAIELAEGEAGVVLTVGDSGPGWSAAGSVGAPLETTKSGGTGVGLFVVRTAVENHGGTLAFGRSPLGGAELVIRFPRAGSAGGSVGK